MNLTEFILPTILFLLIIVTGFLVSKSGKPYNAPLFNLHKLIALATVIITTILMVNLVNISSVQLINILLIVLAGLSILALFATGALLSIQKTVSSIWLIIHRIAPFLLAGSLTAAVLLLLKQ